jgi:hypothetical protein
MPVRRDIEEVAIRSGKSAGYPLVRFDPLKAGAGCGGLLLARERVTKP